MTLWINKGHFCMIWNAMHKRERKENSIKITSIHLDFGHNISEIVALLLSHIRPSETEILRGGWMFPLEPNLNRCYHLDLTIAWMNKREEGEREGGLLRVNELNCFFFLYQHTFQQELQFLAICERLHCSHQLVQSISKLHLQAPKMKQIQFFNSKSIFVL